MKSEDTRIAVRVAPEYKERVRKATDLTGVDESTLVKRSLTALLDFIEENGGVSFPIKVVANPAKKPKKTD